MNEGEALVLGRRAKRCVRWKWAPGMLVFAPALRGAGVPETGPLYARLVSMGGLGIANAAGNERLIDCDLLRPETMLAPDFRDPATLGWLLALVRDAWLTAPAVTARHERCVRASSSGKMKMEHQWTCSYCTGGNWHQAHGETEAESLVAALEAAGTRERGEEDGA